MYLTKEVYFFSILIICTYANLQWPIKICHRTDIKLNECLLNAAKESLPLLTKGIRKMGLKRLEPWNFQKHSFSTSKGPVTVEITVENAVLYGLENTTFKSARFDNKTNTIFLVSHHKKLFFSGKHNSVGSFVLFPLNSDGSFTGFADNLKAIYIVQFKSNKTEINMVMTSVEYAQLDIADNTLGYLGNLALNKVINDNWELFYDVIRTDLEAIMSEEFTEAFKPMLNKYTLDELMPKI